MDIFFLSIIKRSFGYKKHVNKLTTIYMKQCKSCKLEKEFSNFHLYKHSKDGYRYICKDCENKRKRIKNKENREDRLIWAKDYRDKNRKKINRQSREYYSKTIEKRREEARVYYQKNKEKRKIYNKKYNSLNKHKNNARVMKRRASMSKAAINYNKYKSEIYQIYKNCPEGYHVDHIVPLHSKYVCGLHVPWNLQYLTKEENLKKNNKILTTYIDNTTTPTVSSDINSEAANEDCQYFNKVVPNA